MALLEVRDVRVNYGDFQAVRGVSMAVEPSGIVSIIGANGAGKSTLINAVCGINKIMEGEVVFNGKEITNMRTSRIVSQGLTSTPEGSHCFERMTVRDNLLMGAYLCKSAKERIKKLERAYELFPVLKEKQNQLSTYLSGGQRQMLAVARAIMAEPKLLICDEISLGLAPIVIADIYEKLREIAREGVTLVIVDQDVSRSLHHSDYAYVMLEGRFVLQGDSKSLNEDEVNDAFFGMDKYAH